jgi:TRAP-type C4-dicarboxylate transport system substrate-binding protein
MKEETTMNARLNFLTTVLLLAGTVCFAGAAMAQGKSADHKSDLAQAYLAGKLQVPLPKITYTGKPIEVRFSSFIPVSAPIWKVWQPALDRLKAESGGKLYVKLYAGGVLHSMKDGFKAVRDGIADLSHCYPSYEPTSFKLMPAGELSGLFPNAAVGSMVMTELYPKYFKKEYEAMGVYMARITMTPPYNLVSKKPIVTLNDWKGLKVRTTGGMMAKQVAAAGAVPVFVSTSEAYTAFQRGTVDAVAGHDGAFIAFRTAEPAKAWTNPRFAAVETPLCMRKAFFDELPPDLKQLFYGWLQRWNQADAQLWYEGYAATARKKMQGMGIKMVELTQEQRQSVLDAMEEENKTWAAEMNKKGLPADQLLSDMRALSKKYEAMSWDDLFMMSVKEPVKGIVNF